MQALIAAGNYLCVLHIAYVFLHFLAHPQVFSLGTSDWHTVPVRDIAPVQPLVKSS
jgi:hypothetical protein